MTFPSDLQDLPPRGRGLALVGYRGTGKTTVGQILADRLNRRFLDADLEIEARSGRTIASIFAESGEPAFRDWEARTLQELVGNHPEAILATGGGIVLRPSNRSLLIAHGIIVWLKADPAELARRLHEDFLAGRERPALTAAGSIAEISRVLNDRVPLYREVADAEVETAGRSPEEVVETILAVFPGDSNGG
jgi:shikimate kinase